MPHAQMISVILPTFNEEKTLPVLLARLQKILLDPYEIIIIDDHSRDRTQERVLRLREKDKHVRFYMNPRKKGIAPSLHYGFTQAYGESIVWMDCNLKHPPETVPALLHVLTTVDIAKASRYVPGGGDRSEFLRRLTAFMVNKVAFWVLGNIHDYSSGFIAIRRDVLDKVPFPKEARHGEYLVEFLYHAQKKGMCIKEVPFVMEKRGASKTKAKLLDPVYYMLTVIKVKKRVDHA